MKARIRLAGGLLGAMAASLSVAIACGGGEAPSSGGATTTAGGGEQVESPPPAGDDAGPETTEMDAGVAPQAADAGAMAAADAAVATSEDAGGATADADGGAGPTPEERWRAMVRRGRSRFNSVCGTCHPGGGEDIGPRIRGIGWSTSRMRRQIRSGSGRMRPIPPGRLGEADMENLFAYLSTMGSVRGVARPQ